MRGKFLSILLTVAILCTSLPQNVYAVEVIEKQEQTATEDAQKEDNKEKVVEEESEEKMEEKESEIVPFTEQQTEQKTSEISEEEEESETTETKKEDSKTEEASTAHDGTEETSEIMETSESEETTTMTEEETETEETVTEEESQTEETETETETEDDDLQYILGRKMTEEEIKHQRELVPEYLPEIERVEMEASDLYAGLHFGTEEIYLDAASLESKYDGRTQNFLPPIRHQGKWGTCWAFASMAAMESSLVRKGLEDKDSVDLSERHLAYFCNHTGYDELDNANDDTITSPDTHYLTAGGNSYMSAIRLMNWQGAASEAYYPYEPYGSMDEIDREYAQDDAAHIRNVYFVPTAVTSNCGYTRADVVETIKTLVKEYGIVMWSYYHKDGCYNESTGGYYNNQDESSNHAIAVVGWDDTYSAQNFKTQPSSNGAWIVRNSWGTDWGQNGYFYISYEDVSLGGCNPATIFVADNADDYDNNYFYSNGYSISARGSFEKVAQVYQAKGDAAQEQLKAISFMIASDKVPYSIQVYKNPDGYETGEITDPESGTPMLTSPTTGTTGYSGVYTVDLSENVTLSADDYFSVVITFTGSKAMVYTDMNYETNEVTSHNTVHTGQSFCSYGAGSPSSWYDMADEYGVSLRINALTVNSSTIVKKPVLTVSTTQPVSFADSMTCNLSWKKCSDTVGYDIYRSEAEGGTYTLLGSVASSVRTYKDTITTDKMNRPYYYKVRAKYSDGSWVESDVVKQDTEVKLEFIITDFYSCDEKTYLIWKKMDGAAGYEIERKSSEEEAYTQIANITDANSLNYVDDLSDMKKAGYLYRMRAYASDGRYTEWSDVRTVTNSFTLTQNTCNFVTLNIKDYPGAVSYKLFCKKSDTFSPYWGFAQSGTKYLDFSDLAVGDKYLFWLEVYTSYDSAIPAFVSEKVYFYTTPDEIEDLEGSYESNKADFTWSGADGASSIYVYKSMNPDDDKDTPYAVLRDLPCYNYSDTITTYGTYYYSFVPAVTNSKGEVVFGTGATCVIDAALSPLTMNKAEAVDENTVRVSWKQYSGALTYTLYRKTKESSTYNVIAANITDNSYTDNTVQPGITYSYKAVAVTAGGSSSLEKTTDVSVKTVPDVPVLSAKKAESVSIVNKEQLEYAISTTKSYNKLTFKDAQGNIYTFDGLKEDTLYYIYARTKSSITGEESVYSNPLSVRTAKIESLILSVDTDMTKGTEYPFAVKAYTSENEQFDYTGTLTWSAWNDAGMSLKVQNTNGASVIYGSDGKVALRIEDRTITATGISSDNIIKLSASAGKIKTDIKVTITGGVVMKSVIAKDENILQINWYAEKTAVSYQIYRSESKNSGYELIGKDIASSNTSYLDTTVKTGVVYYYKVVAVKESSNSSLDGTVPVKGNTTPARPVLSVLTHNSVTIQNNINCEYAITTDAATIPANGYISDSGSTLSFQNLKGNTRYYIYARTKTASPIYGVALTVTTPIEGRLVLSEDNMVLSRGNKRMFTVNIEPSNVFYQDELVWTGFKPDGTAYRIEKSTDGILSVKGADGGTIIKIGDGYIEAVGESSDKEIYLHVTKNYMEADCHVLVNVPITKLGLSVVSVNGNIPAMEALKVKVGDTVCMNASYEPLLADDTTIHWESSNENIMAVSTISGTQANLAVKGTGICTIRAFTDNGVETSCNIEAVASEEIYELWICASDRNLSKEDMIEEAISGYTRKDFVEESYTLSNNGTQGLPITKSIHAYALKKTGDAYQLEAVTNDKIIFRSGNPAVATVTSGGIITAQGSGEADIYAYDNRGNAAYGRCHVIVKGTEAAVDRSNYAIDKSLKLSAVNGKVTLESYELDCKSCCSLQVKDQKGTLYDAGMFTYTSSNPDVCIVDEQGVVRPNPSRIKAGDAKITAWLKNDKGKRKVTFSVKMVAQKQIAQIILFRDGIQQSFVTQPFNKEDTYQFTAKAYDSMGMEITAPKYKWSLSDNKIASIRTNKDGSVTVTPKKAGTVNLICTGNDTWKKVQSLQICMIDTAPVISTGTLNLNTRREAQAGYLYSDSFTMLAVEGGTTTTPVIIAAKSGKNTIPSEKFSILTNQDGSYCIGMKESDAADIKTNTQYQITLSTQVSGIASLPDSTVTEEYALKLKVIAKEANIKVTESKGINRFYKTDMSTLLVFTTPSCITEVSIPTAKEGQINSFDSYFKVEKRNGQWYLVLDTSSGYDRNNISGKLLITAEGYAPIEKKITVQTPYKTPQIIQQAIPNMNLNTLSTPSAIVKLYNKTKKEDVTRYVIEEVTSSKLEVTSDSSGQLIITLSEGVRCKNGEVLTADILLREKDNGQDPIWQNPVKLKIKVKAVTAVPKLMMKTSAMTLNKQAVMEQNSTKLTANQQNVEYIDTSKWKIKAYNGSTKKYDLQGAGYTDWIKLSYDKQSQLLTVGFVDGKADSVKAGSYKFCISHVLEDFPEVYQNFTINVVDKAPSVKISVSGKLNLYTKTACTLTGKIKGTNTISDICDVRSESSYYSATMTGADTFKLTVTEAGMAANAIENKKTTVPLTIVLKNGKTVTGSMNFTPIKKLPKVQNPKMQTIYKAISNYTRDYNLGDKVEKGAFISRIEIASVPKGISAISRNGHVLITLDDKGIKAGNYQVKVRIYFAGAPDTPVSKSIPVRIAER